tara:strand:+ start:544 stop:795 length:252 start_codon:yes stop_codon:yes gene_type:complete
MAHAARVENGVVREVIVVPDDLGGDENDAAITAYANGIGLPGTWLRTSYNGKIRSRYAGIGFTYDEESDEFIAPVVEEPAEEE